MVARDWHASNQKCTKSHSAHVLKSLENNLFVATGNPDLIRAENNATILRKKIKAERAANGSKKVSRKKT